MILTKQDVLDNINLFKQTIFVYPTDSIYGIGCDATNYDIISKLRTIKHRDEKPFSIIAPSIDWVKEHFVLNEIELEIVNQFGNWIDVDGVLKPFTILLTPKDINFLPENLTFGLSKVGVRIPKHWISDIVSKIGFPIVTTSVNVSGKVHMTSTDDIDKDIDEKLDFIIDDGMLNGSPSTILTVDENKKIVYLKR
ncbi:Sua5/YciO/YrdC/YwlC family protein [Candidatus Woesearchaeota archaeon]|nr:Sua5/YciO/YrdC/YwlC family protein [Candidatus Woesearchaeota archaeon]